MKLKVATTASGGVGASSVKRGAIETVVRRRGGGEGGMGRDGYLSLGCGCGTAVFCV